MNFFRLIASILSSIFSILSIVAILVGGIWLAIDGVCSAILIGLFGSIGVAFLLSLAMSLVLILAAPAAFALKRGGKTLLFIINSPSYGWWICDDCLLRIRL